MSICLQGIDSKIKSSRIEISVSERQPLIRLCNALDWKGLCDLVLIDLKRTTEKGFWQVGRRLWLRTHLGVYLLQSYTGKTDRQIEEELKSNAEYQAFCGKTVLGSSWHCPHHTKLETFRNRLSPETQNRLSECVVKTAHGLGYADPSTLEQDSTVQEANMAYPSDANLLVKLGQKCKEVVDFFKEKKKLLIPGQLNVNMKEIRKKGLAYFFMNKTTAVDEKRGAFKKLFHTVQHEVKPVAGFCESLSEAVLKDLPWNIRKKVSQIGSQTREYLKCVRHFVKTHTLKKGKPLALHLKEVACVVKGKLGKKHEFGRVFQLGRIGGNFIIGLCTKEVRLDDKKSVDPMLKKHAHLFGKGTLHAFATDKGYYSTRNVKRAEEKGAKEIGIARPGGTRTKTTADERKVQERLRARRAGIEPLIGHVKRRGLGKSRMKSDSTTHASGFRAILSFNLRQLMRHQAGKVPNMRP